MMNDLTIHGYPPVQAPERLSVLAVRMEEVSQAILAERERCARIAEYLMGASHPDCASVIAEKIRSGEEWE